MTVVEDTKPVEAQAQAVMEQTVSPKQLRFVIAGSAVGTMIDWYDFYIYGSLATILAAQFFPSSNTLLSLLAAFGIFGVGFAVRPFGALFYGWMGDKFGRKGTFMLTILGMGTATFVIGLLPTAAQIGVFAGVILAALRIIQGLSLGGEYGGAVIYVTEHSPDSKRGYYTSWIQTTATLGFFVALTAVLVTRLEVGTTAFSAWGWRVPFLVSIFLLALGVYLRIKLKETPFFSYIKSKGQLSKNPLRESFGKNWKLITLALLGATAGEGVVWYTGQFWLLYFLQTVAKVDLVTSNLVVLAALAAGAPFFIVFGWLSDRIGRKRVMLTGNILAAVTYVPIFMGISYGATTGNIPLMAFLGWILVLYVTMVYAPIAAYLAELFATRVRYTSMSFPYHIGNGWFGGFVPYIALFMILTFGGVQLGTKGEILSIANPYVGLAYPIAVATMTAIIMAIFVKETKHVKIWDEFKQVGPSISTPPSLTRGVDAERKSDGDIPGVVGASQ